MPTKNTTLHGQVPDSAPVALLIIDMINAFDFEGSEELLEHALPMAHRLADFRRACKTHKIPVVYVNDNFGRWQSDMQKLVEHCLNPDVPGKPVVELIKPDEDDYFVLKPKQSGFFSTTLDTLLLYLQAKTVILAGVAGNICVQFTAYDAYMRDFQLFVPCDCLASNTREQNEAALAQMAQVAKADIRPWSELDLDAIIQEAKTE